MGQRTLSVLGSSRPRWDGKTVREIAPPAERSGEWVLDRFVVEKRPLASGHFGAVRPASDSRGEGLVVKSQKSQLSALRESRGLRQLGRRNDFPQIYGLLDDGKVSYIVMERAQGVPLHKLDLPLSDEETILILRQVLKAVGAMHRKGLLHTDLKPDNILYQRGAKHPVTLVDLGGVAPLPEGGVFRGRRYGTFRYNPPEQFSKPPRLSIPSDLYAVAATAVRLLTGEHPFIERLPTGQGLRRDLLAQRSDYLGILDSVNEPLRSVLYKALSYQPADRYPSAQAFSAALGECLRRPGRHRRPSARRLRQP